MTTTRTTTQHDNRNEVSMKNPTILGWLLQREECPYEDCLERLHDAPDEASTWLVECDCDCDYDDTTTTARRVLPLHLAAQRLQREAKAQRRHLLCDLLSHLLLVHPEAARQVDPSSGGRLPVHDAVQGGVDEETLALFLTIYPESLLAKDGHGKTLFELNQQENKFTARELQSVLELGYEEWKSAHETSPLAIGGVSLSRMDDLMSLASSAASKSTVNTSSRGRQAMQDDSSLASGEDDYYLGQGNNDDTDTSNDHDNGDDHDDSPLVTWNQVKERALALEKVLSEMQHVNHQLARKIQKLHTEGLSIIQRVDRNQGTDLYSMVDVLTHQNERLQQQIQQMDELLRDTVFPNINSNYNSGGGGGGGGSGGEISETTEQLQRRGRVARMLGWLGEPGEGDDNDDVGSNKKTSSTLEQIYKELKASYDQQKAAIREFQFVFDRLDKDDDDDEEASTSQSGTHSLVSNLTMHEDEWTVYTKDQAHPSRSQNLVVEVEFNFGKEKHEKKTKVDAFQVSDNLSSIFRHALQEPSDDPSVNEGSDMAMENLSQMIRVAADREHRTRNLAAAAGSPASTQHERRNVPAPPSPVSSPREIVFDASSADTSPSSQRSPTQASSPSSASPPSKSSFYESSRMFAVITPSSVDVHQKQLFAIRPALSTEEEKVEEEPDLGFERPRGKENAQKMHTIEPMPNVDELIPAKKNQKELCLDERPVQVSFSTVTVRIFDRILCDNPASSSGPSLGIGWEYIPQDALPVNDFEKLRRRQRHGKDDLILSREEREDILLALGYSQQDIVNNVRLLNKSRSQRRQTIVNLGSAKLEEKVELAKRKVKSLLFLKRNAPSMSLSQKSLETSCNSSASSTSMTKEMNSPSTTVNHRKKQLKKVSSVGSSGSKQHRWPSLRRLNVNRVEV